MLTRIIMSVGYIPYIKLVFRMCRRNTCAILTERNAMSVALEEDGMASDQR